MSRLLGVFQSLGSFGEPGSPVFCCFTDFGLGSRARRLLSALPARGCLRLCCFWRCSCVLLLLGFRRHDLPLVCLCKNSRVTLSAQRVSNMCVSFRIHVPKSHAACRRYLSVQHAINTNMWSTSQQVSKRC